MINQTNNTDIKNLSVIGDQLSFEQAMVELEQIVKKLEDGRCPLNEAVITFERGMFLKQHCETLLQKAKLKVDQITLNRDGSALMADGAPALSAFNQAKAS